MNTEVIYADGSHSSYQEDGASFHDGRLAIERLRLITARSALRIYIESGGAFQLTRNGAQLAITNVIEPITGKRYKRSMKGKHEALADVEHLILLVESQTVVWGDDE